MSIGAVIMAAGMSSRMEAFKPLLPLGQDTLIQCALRRLQEAGVEYIVVITGYQSHLIESHLKGWPVTLVKNNQYDRTQMFDSILLGIEKIRGNCDAFFLLPADIPMFRPETLSKMIDLLGNSEKDGVCPTYKGKRGHPVLFSKESIEYITKYDGGNGLKGFIDTLHMTEIQVDDEGILYDADTQEDYQALCRYRLRSVPTEGEIEAIYRINELKIGDKKEEKVAAILEKMGYGKVAEIIKSNKDLKSVTENLIDDVEKGQYLERLSIARRMIHHLDDVIGR